MSTPQEIAALKAFFASATIPHEIELSQGTRITDTKKFMESHLPVLDVPNQWHIHGMFIERLKLLKAVLEKSSG